MDTRGATINSQRSGQGAEDLRAVLERLAHHAALEARLQREDAECLGSAVAAVRRVSLLLVRKHGLQVREDERGDVWALDSGATVAFLGNSHDIDARSPQADVSQPALAGKRRSLRSILRSAASHRSTPTRSAR